MVRSIHRRAVACAIVILILALPLAAIAQDNQCTVNGCGPDGVLGRLIPDRYRGYFAQCEFKDACNKHDKCYSNCMKCSSWYGTERCKEKSCWFSWDTSFKSQCDEQLYTDISLANSANGVCEGFASAYKAAVKLLGCSFYYGQTFSRQKQLQFQQNFDALMQYFEYHRKNDIPLESKPLDAFVDQLSRSPAVEQNVLDFTVRRGAPTLSLDAIDGQALPKAAPSARAPPTAPPTTDGVRIRRYINGIDVTNMQDRSNTFALENQPKSRRPFDLKIELDVKQGADPSLPRTLDYKSFNELRDLKDLNRLNVPK